MAEQLSFLTTPKKGDRRIVFFDLETMRSADEVGGWSNISKMGLACGVCYDSVDQKYYEYYEKDAEALIQKLKEADLVVGYNILKFDYIVLTAYSDFKFSLLSSFDMLVDVTKALGHRLKLDSIVKATLGAQKSGDGLQSLRWVKEGRMDLVTEYCKKDVELTRDLFWFGEKNGFISYENRQETAKVMVDWSLDKLIKP